MTTVITKQPNTKVTNKVLQNGCRLNEISPWGIKAVGSERIRLDNWCKSPHNCPNVHGDCQGCTNCLCICDGERIVEGITTTTEPMTTTTDVVSTTTSPVTTTTEPITTTIKEITTTTEPITTTTDVVSTTTSPVTTTTELITTTIKEITTTTEPITPTAKKQKGCRPQPAYALYGYDSWCNSNCKNCNKYYYVKTICICP